MKAFVLCKECVVAKKTSVVKPGPMVNTDKKAVDEFYSTDGKLHQHDENEYGRHYICTEGHNWDEYWKNNCWCQS